MENFYLYVCMCAYAVTGIHTCIYIYRWVQSSSIFLLNLSCFNDFVAAVTKVNGTTRVCSFCLTSVINETHLLFFFFFFVRSCMRRVILPFEISTESCIHFLIYG